MISSINLLCHCGRRWPSDLVIKQHLSRGCPGFASLSPPQQEGTHRMGNFRICSRGIGRLTPSLLFWNDALVVNIALEWFWIIGLMSYLHLESCVCPSCVLKIVWHWLKFHVCFISSLPAYLGSKSWQCWEDGLLQRSIWTLHAVFDSYRGFIQQELFVCLWL